MEQHLTTFLAVWGALMSTAAIAWNIARDLGDKGRLKLEGMVGKMYPDHTDRNYLVITITNVGKRPVMVKGVAAKKGRSVKGPRGVWLVPRGLPTMLAQGEYHTEYTHEFGFLSSEVKEIYAWDSTGKKWKLPRSELRQLRKEFGQLTLG